MKMVKSLLLGSAAGLVAVTAGQAADLPVKAKPVEYVKICSLYGAGFYYMPGTDMCIKIGGWVRTEATWGGNGNMAWGPYNANVNNRNTNNYFVRSRGYITADAREQTAYGTLRAYIDVGLSTSDLGTSASEGVFSSNRAFLQWMGFTTGVSVSFYDFYQAAASLYRAGYLPSEDTGDGGWWVWGYTAQLGNGWTATVSAEERRMDQIIGQTGVGSLTGTLTSGSTAGLNYGGQQAPDVVGNIRLDQAWGSAQVMGAAHEVEPIYYGSLPITGHVSDQWGFAVGAGLRLNFPMIAQGDYFQGEVNYTQGAVKYVNNGENTNYDRVNGNTQVFGIMSDCVYGGTTSAVDATGCNLTTAWGFNAAYEHYWTPQWHESFVGGYTSVQYNSAANAMLCAAASDGSGVGTTAVALSGCGNNWQFWGVGSRLQWDVTKSFYLGVEVLYTKMMGASTSDNALHGYSLLPSTSSGVGVTTVAGNMDNWAFTVRAHKDFLP